MNNLNLTSLYKYIINFEKTNGYSSNDMKYFMRGMDDKDYTETELYIAKFFYNINFKENILLYDVEITILYHLFVLYSSRRKEFDYIRKIKQYEINITKIYNDLTFEYVKFIYDNIINKLVNPLKIFLGIQKNFDKYINKNLFKGKYNMKRYTSIITKFKNVNTDTDRRRSVSTYKLDYKKDDKDYFNIYNIFYIKNQGQLFKIWYNEIIKNIKNKKIQINKDDDINFKISINNDIVDNFSALYKLSILIVDAHEYDITIILFGFKIIEDINGHAAVLIITRDKEVYFFDPEGSTHDEDSNHYLYLNFLHKIFSEEEGYKIKTEQDICPNIHGIQPVGEALIHNKYYHDYYKDGLCFIWSLIIMTQIVAYIDIFDIKTIIDYTYNDPNLPETLLNFANYLLEKYTHTPEYKDLIKEVCDIDLYDYKLSFFNFDKNRHLHQLAICIENNKFTIVDFFENLIKDMNDFCSIFMNKNKNNFTDYDKKKYISNITNFLRHGSYGFIRLHNIFYLYGLEKTIPEKILDVISEYEKERFKITYNVIIEHFKEYTGLIRFLKNFIYNQSSNPTFFMRDEQ